VEKSGGNESKGRKKSREGMEMTGGMGKEKRNKKRD